MEGQGLVIRLSPGHVIRDRYVIHIGFKNQKNVKTQKGSLTLVIEYARFVVNLGQLV